MCLVSLLVVCGVLTATAAFAAPLKIAIVESLSGPQASTGLLYRAAAKYGIDILNANGGWNGEPIQLLEYDNQGGITGASEKVKAAIADGAQIIMQGSSSAVGGQVTEDVRKSNLRNPGNEVLYMNIGAEAMELTGAKAHFHQFRFSPNAEIRMKAVIATMKEANVLGTRVYSMNQNYSWGVDVENAIVENASAGGYEVVGKTLHDVNKIQDFSPYVAKIKAANAETVITGNWSNDLLLLMKATNDAGLKVRFGTAFLDQPGNIANAGETALGHYVAQAFNIEAGGAEAQKLAEDYKSKTGHYPSYVEPQTIFGVAMLGEALKSVKPEAGRLNVNMLVLALEKTKYKSPMGEQTIRTEDHQILLPMVVSVVSKDAKYEVDGTDMGFVPVKVMTAAEAAAPVQAVTNIIRPK
jgi:branched-chain amino acid transport system substrate-binding protein